MINKVMYIKYEGTKRQTVMSNMDRTAFVLKYDTVEKVDAVVEPLVTDEAMEQQYMDYLTNRMFDKIRANKLKMNGGN